MGPSTSGGPAAAHPDPAGDHSSWRALTAGALLGFAPASRERAYQQWKQEQVAPLSAAALCAQIALTLLPASLVWLYGLLWMNGGGAWAVFLMTAMWVAAGQVPAAMSMWLPALYARHHDAIWALSTLACALIPLAAPASGVLPCGQVPSMVLRHMLELATLVHMVLPVRVLLAPAWQLLASSSGFITLSAGISSFTDGAVLSPGPAGHAALLAASVATACAMEWRSRSRWLHTRGAGLVPGPPAPGAAALPGGAAGAAGPAGKH